MPKRLPQLAFGYPRRGLSGTFNTVRLGVGAVADCQPGRIVELVDARSKKVLGRARVLYVIVGLLNEVAPKIAHQAHNWKDHPVPSERAGLLIASMKRRYPPNRVKDDSVVSVFYLKEIPDDSEAE